MSSKSLQPLNSLQCKLHGNCTNYFTKFATPETTDVTLSASILLMIYSSMLPTNNAVFITVDKDPSVVAGLGVNDIIRCDDRCFWGLSQHHWKVFWNPGKLYPTLNFVRVPIEKIGHRFLAHQWDYARSLDELCLEARFDQFRMMHHKLALLSTIRLDVCSLASKSSQGTEANFEVKHIEM